MCDVNCSPTIKRTMTVKKIINVHLTRNLIFPMYITPPYNLSYTFSININISYIKNNYIFFGRGTRLKVNNACYSRFSSPSVFDVHVMHVSHRVHGTSPSTTCLLSSSSDEYVSESLLVVLYLILTIPIYIFV